MRLVVFSFLIVLCGSVAAGAPMVVVVSMDGLRHDAPDTPGLQALKRMQDRGLRADGLTPVYPSNTFPGHVSIATGTHPDVHGIVDNVFFDRNRGLYAYSADASWIGAEPIWAAAERQGVPAATYFWVGSETDWQGVGARYRMAPFDGGRPEAEKVAQMLAWLSLPEAERPRLVMSYFAGSDRVAHNFGPDSDRVVEQLLSQDAELLKLIEGIDTLKLWPQLTLIVVSDHGMTAMGEYVSIGDALEHAGIGARVVGYTVAHVFLDQPEDLPAAQQVLEADTRLRVLTQTEASASGRRFAAPNRSGDLVVLAEPPVIFHRPDGFEGIAMAGLRIFGWDFGGHGYDPERPDMAGVFLAMGRGVPENARIPRVHQIDVAPTIAHLLGIDDPAHAEGTTAIHVHSEMSSAR